jgi:hypothetical protein
MAEKIFEAQSNYGWGLSLNMTGKAPAIAKRIWNTKADALEYVNNFNDSAIEGLQLSVVADPIAKNNGVYFVEKIGTFKVVDGAQVASNDGVLTKVGGTETETADTYSAAVTLSSTLVAGQLIKVTNKEVVGEITYDSGFYLVNTPGNIIKLATTTASGDFAADIAALQEAVTEIKRDYAKTSDLADYATVAGWKVKDVDANDKVLSLTGGVLSSSLSYTREAVDGVDSLVLKGKNNAVLGSVPVADFIVDGMLQNVELDGDNLVFTFNTDAGDHTIVPVDLSKYITVYTGKEGEVKVEGNVISLINPFTTAHAETLASALQPAALEPFAKSAEVVANSVFNPWKESVDAKLGELEVAIGDAGKVDDVQHNGTSIVDKDTKIAELNKIFASSIDDSEGDKALSVSLAKDSFLKIDDVVALKADEIDAIINPTQTEPNE